jgi:ABC-type branched-subunit amino acid transport system substrate-binding protein
MKLRNVLRLVATCTALVSLAAACSSSSSSSSSGSSESGAGSSSVDANSSFVALGGWADPPCSASQPKIEVAIQNPIDVAGTALKDYVDGTQAAVDAFNARGGINNRCINLNVCDGKTDGPTELACARQQTDNPNVVAGLASQYFTAEADAYKLFEAAGLPQVGAQVALPGGWNSPVSFEFTMGGSGALLAGIPALASIGAKKFVVFLPATGQAGAVATFAQPMVTALGMELVETIQIPPTAVEFTQFILAAQNAGAEGGVLALPGNVASQMIDAADSVNSTLKLSASWGTFSHDAVAGIPDNISGKMAFSDAVPPAVPGSPTWPIYDTILGDFAKSGKPNLLPGAETAQATNGWLSVYALIKVMRDAKATEITRATVKAAFDAATNVPMFDLTPPWTPSKQSTSAIFTGISNPNYWTGHWDTSSKAFVVDPKQADLLALLG